MADLPKRVDHTRTTLARYSFSGENHTRWISHCPKSSPGGDFRLSYSFAETMLMKTQMPLGHKVMTAFKAVMKYYKKTWSSNLKEVISSCHLKTIAFWHFEKTSQESWTVETLVHHLITLLEELAKL